MHILGKIFVIGSAFWTFTAFSASLGRDVQVLRQDGQFKLGVQYTYEPSSVSWTMTATVLTESLPTTRPLFVRAYNPKSDTFLSDWAQSGLILIASSRDVMTLSMDRKSALHALKAFPDVVLLFSADRSSVAANLSLQQLCQSSPSSFIDLTFNRTGCAPDHALLDTLAEDVGGLCSPDLHKRFCSITYDGVRDAIAKQHHCVFDCK